MAPRPAAGELNLENVGRVVKERGDALAAAHATNVPQVAGEARDAFVVGGVAEMPAAGEIDGGHAIRSPARVMADPVVMAWHRHFILLESLWTL